MELRKATLQDAPDVVSCVVAAFKGYMPLIGKTPGPMLEDYYEAIQREHVFVASEGEGGIQGCILIKEGEGEVMWLDVLAVHPGCRGSGIGKALILHGEDFMRAQGKTECRLYTHVKYEKTVAIYRYLDYEIYDRVQEQGYDRYYMKKRLGEGALKPR